MTLFSSETAIIIALAFLVIKEIAQLLNWGKKLNQIIKTIDTIDTTVCQTWKLHDVVDEDGVPVWYFRKSLDKLLTQLSKSQLETNSLLAVLTTHIGTQNKLTERMIDKLESIEAHNRDSHQKILDAVNKKG